MNAQKPVPALVLLQRIMEVNYTFPHTPQLSSHCRDLITRMLVKGGQQWHSTQHVGTQNPNPCLAAPWPWRNSAPIVSGQQHA